MSEPSPRPTPSPPSSPPLGRVALHAVASGLTPLIPVPFLDDYALFQVREQLVRSLLEERGLRAPNQAVEALAGSSLGRTLGGRLASYLKGMMLLPVKKLFRKVFFVLWVKDCVDVASVSLHHGYLLHHALERGDLDALSLQGDKPRAIHAAIVAACAEVDARPVNQALRRLFASSRLLVAEATRVFLNPRNVGPRAPEPGESAEVKSLADRLLALLWEERGYFSTLEAHYVRHLEAGPAPVLSATSGS
ncbi:hypothetical protein FJV41_20170 [Myxococcus llanfairpwllgwyngyllgogerychwyrndrobwllllantysiliogogogochensis]|uniref:Uncharacterized protein n=1 Tax=Myxococcus llanfairpwllgwyngyllgogerychwyrndrobwllllantysiliogogogochensis TaxID=2590453 RepID=A0A540WYS6_9BACT|nr:hypothetical protein [Myxococcus llanfairpwllgwyngyllgogerychwyrndrobwllllantysiliogogogochensis]TQF14155.1 hypothetical protein FJV41_20170 [Myxococcus llanfairpwllgwyngyllgogerychwyrndrobwllllantysiliogogogochensis]